MSTELETRLEPASAEGGKPSWGAPIIGGLTAVGTAIALLVLGAAIMYSTASYNPRGAFAWILTWSLIVPVPSALVGGLVCARTAGPLKRSAGALHGLASWGIATAAAAGLAMLFMAGGARALPSPMLAFNGYGAGAAGAAVGGAAVNPGAEVAFRARDILSTLDTQLLAEGRPALSEQRLVATLSLLPPTAWSGSPAGVNAVALALQRAAPLPHAVALQFAGDLMERFQVLSKSGALSRGAGGAAYGGLAMGGTGSGAVGGSGIGSSMGMGGYVGGRLWPATFWAGSVATYFWFLALSLAVSAAAGAFGGALTRGKRDSVAVQHWTHALRRAEA